MQHVRNGVLVFEVYGQSYGLSLDYVIQTVKMMTITPLPAVPDYVVGAAAFQRRFIPVVDMRRRLRQPLRPYTEQTPIVVGRMGHQTVGLVVDRVSGVISLAPEQIEPCRTISSEGSWLRPRHLFGTAQSDNGTLLLLNPVTFPFASKASSRKQKAALSARG